MIDLIITIAFVLLVVCMGIWLFDEDDWRGAPNFTIKKETFHEEVI